MQNLKCVVTNFLLIPNFSYFKQNIQPLRKRSLSNIGRNKRRFLRCNQKIAELSKKSRRCAPEMLIILLLWLVTGPAHSGAGDRGKVTS